MENKFDISMFVDVLTQEQCLCNLVNRFISVRKKKKISQKKLEKLSGVSYGSIRRFESTGQISLHSLMRLAMALDYLSDFEKLFSEKPITSLKEIFYDKNY